MTTCNAWCFTQNSDPQSFLRDLGRIYEANKTKIVYICGQLEQGAHLHVQGYVQLKRSQRLSAVRNLVSDTAHFERQRGTNQQARDYCMKEDETTVPGTFVEYGKFRPGKTGQGARNDVILLRDSILEGRNQRELIADNDTILPFARFIKFADRFRSLVKPAPRPDGVEVLLFVGSPGTGKTRKAHEDYPDLYVVPISNGTLWLDGYDDHENVLFDDFMGRGSKMTLDNTLKFFDRYVQQVPIKGAHVWWRPAVIIVTSNYHPRGWYDFSKREESYVALERRFTRVLSFTSLHSEPVEEDIHEYFTDKELWPLIDLEQ